MKRYEFLVKLDGVECSAYVTAYGVDPVAARSTAFLLLASYRALRCYDRDHGLGWYVFWAKPEKLCGRLLIYCKAFGLAAARSLAFEVMRRSDLMLLIDVADF